MNALRARARWVTTLALAMGTGCAAGGDDEATAPSVPGAAPACGAGACVGKASGVYPGEPGAGVEFLAYGPQRQRTNPAWGSGLNDIAAHLPGSYGNTYDDPDLVTFGHETSHGIHSDLRNNHNALGRRANGFYVMRDRAVLVAEPAIRKGQVAQFVPASLRGGRYAMYVTGQVEWDDTPLYIWDEWNAYVNGSEVAVALARVNLWRAGSRDAVEGTLEFVVYAISLAMAVEQGDPGYFREHRPFLEFLAWNVRRSMDLYRAGSQMEPFARDSQTAFHERMRTSVDAEAWRSFARRIFGATWADAVLFGDGAVVPPGPDAPDGPPPIPDDELDDGSGEEPPPPLLPDLEDTDLDTDGVLDPADLCSETPRGATVWRAGEWAGCAAGQLRDEQRGGAGGPDGDVDGVADAADLCSRTPAASRVWRTGEWAGCAEGQRRDPPRAGGPDGDGDGVADVDDLCSGSPAGVAVWRAGGWRGCAEGELRDD